MPIIKPSVRLKDDALKLTEWVYLLPLPRKMCDLKDVTRVWALNRNALTRDEVWLAFETADGTHHDVSELWTGFGELRDALPRVFPGIDQSWVDMHKADETFLEKDQLIWERGSEAKP